jgi:hypothetical protein
LLKVHKADFEVFCEILIVFVTKGKQNSPFLIKIKDFLKISFSVKMVCIKKGNLSKVA